MSIPGKGTTWLLSVESLYWTQSLPQERSPRKKRPEIGWLWKGPEWQVSGRRCEFRIMLLVKESWRVWGS